MSDTPRSFEPSQVVGGERVGSRCQVTDLRPWLQLGPQLAHVDRDGAQSAGRIEVEDGAQLNRALLEVHAAREMPEFWDTTRRLLHSALPPLHFTCMAVRPFAIVPPTIFRECAPFASEAEFKRFQAINPMQVFLRAHPGATVVRMSEVLEDRALVRTEFYRQFMRPNADRYIVYLNFWNADLFHGRIGLHRRGEQGDFTATEVALLERLHPQFDVALRRIVSQHRERAVRLSLEQLAGTLPVATMLLDWELKIVFGNDLARDLCACWNAGAQPAPSRNSGDSDPLAPEVVAYCQSLKGAWNPRLARDLPLTGLHGVTVSHPHHAGLRATITLLQLDGAPLSMPMFLIRFEDQRGAPVALVPVPEALGRLSVREREVALLVSEGCSNAEVARQLRKGVQTVKKQLRSIYQKLNVPNRGRLTARLHEAMTASPAGGAKARKLPR